MSFNTHTKGSCILKDRTSPQMNQVLIVNCLWYVCSYNSSNYLYISNSWYECDYLMIKVQPYRHVENI